MSMEYIRKIYNCPAKRGMEIRFRRCIHEEWVRGIIIGSRGQYLRVRFIGNLGIFTLHPTWGIEYKNPITNQYTRRSA